ncbi:C4-dicarboxylate transporter DctA [Tunturiibacter lichenicola]|uniref:C4-dicarboxylate transporter DctA n=1 Tax=Tunturiibacter lichenicola TaxID=2051959 RepID=UPI0021B3F67C|nr:C4-dicarboxylate transporter DctA [Edaphobacter lichenicola]
MTTPDQPSIRFTRTLYFRVIVGILAGVAVGYFAPHVGEQLKPIGDGFIKLVRMLVTPIIFLTVVVGIASMGDTRRLGRVGIKAIVYFEAVTTLALVIGFAAVSLIRPGAGMNVDSTTLDSTSVAQYVAQGKHLDATGFVLNIIPDSFVGAFANGEILQVLLLAILTGIALVAFDDERRLLSLAKSSSHLFFRITALVMELAPFAAFGAMGFTIGKYGLGTLVSLGKVLLCVYATCILFVVVVLGLICFFNGISLWKLLLYLKEELLIVLGTSSSEPALPGLIAKMERLGCSEMVAGLVIPSGYSFNLDGTSIYLTIAVIFIAQATNTHLTIKQELFVIFMLMLNSKGAAAVTGGGFITLAATLAALGSIPVAGITLLLGIDRFMSEMRSLTNLIGNAVATITVARWEGQFDVEHARRVLNNNKIVPESADLEKAEELR